MQQQVAIETRNLTVHYGDFKAVDSLDLTVRQGEIFGFLGPNGAGKSTTIRTVMDFIRPTTGGVRVLGHVMRKMGPQVRQQIGYLPAELTLWENWTGRQYVSWLSGVYKEDLRPEAQRLAQALDFDLKRSLQGMSTGMKRKMGLIAALAHQPELLILDEPTNGLDPLIQKVFHDILLDWRERGGTVFLSSHILSEVEQICDRVGIIQQGKLKAVETVSDLTKVTFRWMTLYFDQPVTPNGFGSITGVSELQTEGNRLKMRVAGDASIDQIVKQASQHTVTDMQLEKPSLEEIFLTFYNGKEG